MPFNCSLSDPWSNNDVVPCVRETLIDSLLPVLMLALSCLGLIAAMTKFRKASSALYTPLKNSLLNHVSYGSASLPSGQASENNDGQDEASGPSSSSASTIAPTYETYSPSWSLFSIVRLLAGVQLFGAIYAIRAILNDTYPLDSAVETSLSGVLWVFGVRALFWGYAFLLAASAITLPASYKPVTDTICSQLNWMYAVDIVIGVVDLHSFYLVHYLSHIGLGYGLRIAMTSLSMVMLTVMFNEARNAPRYPVMTESGRELSPERWASPYSKFMFSWVNGMMAKGYTRTLNDEDMVELPPDNRAKNVLIDFRNHRVSSLLWSILSTFKWPLIRMALYCMVWNIGVFGPPLFLNRIIKYIESPDKEHREPASTAYIYVCCLFIASVGQSLAVQQALYIGRTMGIRLQAIVIGEVFAKSLRRRDDAGVTKDESDTTQSKSNINNLLSVDAQKLGEFVAYVFYIYCYPFQIVASIWLLYRLLGKAALYGVLVMLISQPLPYYVSRRFETVQERVMAATDKRIKLINEMLSAIRIVKFFAWEKQFRERVVKARDEELKSIYDRLMAFMYMINIWFLLPVLIMATVFYTYTMDNVLTAATAFTALALFNTFRAALDEFPMMISFMMQAIVSLRRIEKFLNDEEVSVDAVQQSTTIGFTGNASFGWDSPTHENAKPTLKGLNLTFPRNKLSIICGPTGSGKTTLLASLLGETYRYSGNALLPRRHPSRTTPLGGAESGIAYVAQTAWLQNCSVRDNILFGLPMDEERYEKVLYMTALTRDLEILEFGDATEIGEKGVTLSGGQKQRVAIARAVYSQAEIVILDDCLSAVDAHTAKHLHEHCLTGELMRGRTIILVTHHVGLCLKDAAYVVALKDGEVVGAGDPETVLNSGVLGEELARAKEESMDEDEGKAVEGPIPMVPKTVAKKDLADGAGKLVKDEERAEGSVSWYVYEAYLKASGGYWFWALLVFLFTCMQTAVLGQDYWIKVWASAYGTSHADADNATASMTGVFSASGVPFIQDNGMTISYLHPLTTLAPQEVDIVYYLGVYIAIGILSLVLATIRSYIMFRGSVIASRRIHTQLLDRILNAKVRFFDTTPIGRIVNRFSSDMANIDQEISPSLSFLLYSLVSTVVITLLIATITPTFIIAGVFIGFAYWYMGTYYLATSRDMKRLNSVSRSPIYVQFGESVNGVTTIRAFGSQRRFLNVNHQLIDNNNRPFIWMWASNRWLHCRVETMGAFVGFCVGFVLVLARDTVDPGLAGLSLSYALTFTHHVLWIIRQYSQVEMLLNSAERVVEYLNIDQEPSAEKAELVPPPQWPMTGAIQVKDLVMQYAPENPPVLRGISFETRGREKIGIVGRTGSGKSTLALSIFRFMEATQGQIIIDGVDISRISLHDLRSRLTIIPQDPVLFSGTLRSNLDPFEQYSDADLWAALKRVHLNDNQEEPITLDAVVTENGNNWSQGQRQLIALARALVKKSALIILDEATSSVDFDTDHKIQQTIRQEFKESALLCIAHRIRTVVDYDRILVLDHGRVVEFDTPYTLMTRSGGVFQSMCERSGEFNELLAIAKAKHEQI